MSNMIAFRTIVTGEIVRFIRIWPQTLLPPVITTALYFMIFGRLIGDRFGDINGVHYMDYIVPGIILMSVISNAYANVVASFYSSKFQHNIEELLEKDNFTLIEGDIRNILTGERVALNFLSHISGITTITNQFVKKVGKKSKICCTRKTIPNLRVIQKYAVKLGGGTNHRFNLSDEYLIKDNHIGTNQNLINIVKKAIKNKKGKKITVEVDNLNQLKQIIGLKFDRILFDNMSPQILRRGAKLSKKLYETEASGGITLKNVKKIAATGVDRISVGSITHSAVAIDLKIEI